MELLFIAIALTLVIPMIAALLFQSYKLNTPLAILKDELKHLACFHALEAARREVIAAQQAASGRADAEACGLLRRVADCKAKVRGLELKYASHSKTELG